MNSNHIIEVQEHISELELMKKYPKKLYAKGDLSLLQRQKISIVGGRRANSYAKTLCHQIASKLAHSDCVVVSGGAIGIDTIAHKAAGANKTIMISGTGLDKRYPSINNSLIESIENEGLVLSQFETGVSSKPYHFPLRNELIVALGEVLIVPYADLDSGTMRSVEYALRMQKKIFVLPHRLSESQGTQNLAANNQAEVIYDIDMFIDGICKQTPSKDTLTPIMEYLTSRPKYDEAVKLYGDLIYEYELEGKIKVLNGTIVVV